MHCPYEQNRQPENLVPVEPHWRVGDRVVVEVEGNDCYGEIVYLYPDQADIKLDNGAESTFDLYDIQREDGEVELVDKGSTASCRILIVACRFVVSNNAPICARCISNEAWNDAAGVPQLRPEDEARIPPESDAMALVRESPFFQSLYKQSLKGRLIGGDCPRYQEPNPVDLSVAFAGYRTATSDSEAEDLLAEMLDKQLAKAKANIDGTHPESVVRDKIATLAEENGFLTPTEAAELRG